MSKCMRFFLVALAFFSFSSIATAQEYYWVRKNAPNSPHYPSAKAACGGNELSMSSNPAEATCLVRDMDGWIYTSYAIVRVGDTCSGVYDPDIGSCTIPGGQTCEGEGTPKSGFGFITNASGACVDYTQADVPSQCKNLGGQGGFTNVYVTFDSDGNPQMPPPMNVGGCEATPMDVGHCKMAPVRKFPTGGSIQSSVNKCKIGVNFTGNTSGNAPYAPPPLSSGPGDDGICDNPGGCPDPADPPIQNDKRPCVYVEDGEGRRVCSSSQWNAKPGQSNCGAVNGKWVCIGKAPTSNGISIDTTVTDTKNPDGSTTSVKDDKITQTICSGAYSCSTQTSNNKTTIIKDANGNTTGQSSDCTGPHCSVDGKDDKDGDGLKDCIGVGCGFGSGSGNGDGDGDEGDEEFGGPENEDVGTFGETTSQFMDRVEGSPIVSAARGLSFGSGGSCSFGSFTVPMLGTLSFQPMCAWAAEWFAPLRAIMLAVWALVAVRTFFEA